MFNQYIALAKEYLAIHKAFYRPLQKFEDFKSCFIKQKHIENIDGNTLHITRYLIEKKGFPNGQFVYRDYSSDSDYDDSSEYNYISYNPGSPITVFYIGDGNNEPTTYPYELFADLDEELFFQYSTVYTEKELKMLVLYWYFNKHCWESFYLQLLSYDEVCDIYNKTVEI